MQEKTYVILLRGINVGGNSRMSMVDLRTCLKKLGFTNVSTYIASGNVIIRSKEQPSKVQTRIEQALPKYFKLKNNRMKVRVLTKKELQTIIAKKPKGFGEEPKKYHSDIIFLMDIPGPKALSAFSPKEGVDKIWAGASVVYSQRLSALRTKSRLNKIMSSPLYQAMTIRTWNTTTKLFDIMSAMDAS